MAIDERRALAAAAEAGADAAVPPVDVVWDALAAVPDPEIPAVSIVDLGMVRAVDWDGARLRIEVTPTYSGCPATDVIAGTIRERLAALGFAAVDVVMRLAPPWSTDWMAPEAKAKLAAYGIAPPQARAAVVDVAGMSPTGRREGEYRSAQREGSPVSPLRRAPPVPCPRCRSPRTTLLSQFGSTACKALYRCDACREPFDYFKPH